MATTAETKHRITRRWNFGTSQHPLTLDEFLERKSLHFDFFAGSEPWVGDHDRVTWESFFRFCTEEMDDLSKLTCGMVIEYCLAIIEKLTAKVKRPVTRQEIQDALERVSRNRDNWEVEHRLLMPDGSIKHVHVVAHPVTDDAGDLQLMGAVMDITPHKQALAALERSELRYRQLFRDMPVALWQLDAQPLNAVTVTI